MRNWSTIFAFELKYQFRRKGYLFVTFGLPLLIIMGFLGYQALDAILEQEGDESLIQYLREEPEETDAIQTIGYIDQSREGLFPPPEQYVLETPPPDVQGKTLQDLTPEEFQLLTHPSWFTGIIRAFPDEDAGIVALRSGEIDVLYGIPTDFTESAEVVQYFDDFNFTILTQSSVFQTYLLASLLYNTPALPAADYEVLFLRLREPSIVSENRVTAGVSAESDAGQNLALAYIFTLAMMFSLLWGSNYLMQIIVQDKENRIIEILMSSAQPPALLIGKLLAVTVASLLQVLLLGGTAVFIAQEGSSVLVPLEGVELQPLNLVLMVVYWLLGFFFFGSLMACAGAISTTLREAQNLAPLVILPAMIPYFFLAIISDDPNGSLATTLSFIPVTTSLTMIVRFAISDVPFSQVVGSLAIVAVFAAGGVWLAARLFRVNTLLRGKMPRLKDIPHLLRG